MFHASDVPMFQNNIVDGIFHGIFRNSDDQKSFKI